MFDTMQEQTDQQTTYQQASVLRYASGDVSVSTRVVFRNSLSYDAYPSKYTDRNYLPTRSSFWTESDNIYIHVGSRAFWVKLTWLQQQIVSKIG